MTIYLYVTMGTHSMILYTDLEWCSHHYTTLYHYIRCLFYHFLFIFLFLSDLISDSHTWICMPCIRCTPHFGDNKEGKFKKTKQEIFFFLCCYFLFPLLSTWPWIRSIATRFISSEFIFFTYFFTYTYMPDVYKVRDLHTCTIWFVTFAIKSIYLYIGYTCPFFI